MTPRASEVEALHAAAVKKAERIAAAADGRLTIGERLRAAVHEFKTELARQTNG